MSGPSVVMDAALADRVRPGLDSVAVVPRRRAAPWRMARWRPLDPDDVIEVLGTTEAPALVLVRPAAADPGGAPLAPVARLLGHDVVVLSGPAGEAARTAGIVLGLRAAPRAHLERVLDVLCCASDGPSAPDSGACAWPPEVRPEVLARWAVGAWRPCGWCRGGGLPGTGCRACGSPIGSGEAAA